MSKTKAEIRNRALQLLGELAIGATPTADLANDMEDVYDQVYARLESRGLVTWSSTDPVPDEFVEDIAAMMAFDRAEGVPPERYSRIANAAATATQSISAVISGRWINRREYTDY